MHVRLVCALGLFTMCVCMCVCAGAHVLPYFHFNLNVTTYLNTEIFVCLIYYDIALKHDGEAQ